MYLSKILVIAKYLLMALIGSSFDLFGFLGMAQPTFWTWATDNKLFAIMMTFFFTNMIEAQLISSGAFEISLNGEWCKVCQYFLHLYFTYFRYADLVKDSDRSHSSTAGTVSNHRKSFAVHGQPA